MAIRLSLGSELGVGHGLQRARWRNTRVFEALTGDLRQVLCLDEARASGPSAVIFDSRTLQSTPESGHWAGYDGAKRRKGSKVHVAIGTLGHLLAAVVTPANEQDWAQVGLLAQEMQVASDQSVTLAYADKGYTDVVSARAAQGHGSDLRLVKLDHPAAGLRTATPPLGGRAQFKLERPLQTAGPRLRTPRREFAAAPLPGLCWAHAHQSRQP